MGLPVFGEVVQTQRKVLGLTLQNVADAIESQKGYVSGIENQKVNPPSWKVIRKYARVLKLDEDYLGFLAAIYKLRPQKIRVAMLKKGLDIWAIVKREMEKDLKKRIMANV